jgi:hypothetical protein
VASTTSTGRAHQLLEHDAGQVDLGEADRAHPGQLGPEADGVTEDLDLEPAEGALVEGDLLAAAGARGLGELDPDRVTTVEAQLDLGDPAVDVTRLGAGSGGCGRW